MRQGGHGGLRRPRASAPGGDERHGPQHHHQHAPDLGHRLGRGLRARQPGRRHAARRGPPLPRWISRPAIPIGCRSRTSRATPPRPNSRSRGGRSICPGRRSEPEPRRKEPGYYLVGGRPAGIAARPLGSGRGPAERLRGALRRLGAGRIHRGRWCRHGPRPRRGARRRGRALASVRSCCFCSRSSDCPRLRARRRDNQPHARRGRSLQGASRARLPERNFRGGTDAGRGPGAPHQRGRRRRAHRRAGGPLPRQRRSQCRFAILSDWRDAPQESLADDAALLAAAAQGIAELNLRHPRRGAAALLPDASAASVERGAGRLDGLGTETRQAPGAQSLPSR